MAYSYCKKKNNENTLFQLMENPKRRTYWDSYAFFRFSRLRPSSAINKWNVKQFIDSLFNILYPTLWMCNRFIVNTVKSITFAGNCSCVHNVLEEEVLNLNFLVSVVYFWLPKLTIPRWGVGAQLRLALNSFLVFIHAFVDRLFSISYLKGLNIPLWLG